jgi:hypothetical protein
MTTTECKLAPAEAEKKEGGGGGAAGEEGKQKGKEEVGGEAMEESCGGCA